MCKECEVQKTHQEQLKGFNEKEQILFKHTHTHTQACKKHKEQIFFKLCAVVTGDGYQFKECLLSMIQKLYNNIICISHKSIAEVVTHQGYHSEASSAIPISYQDQHEMKLSVSPSLLVLNPIKRPEGVHIIEKKECFGKKKFFNAPYIFEGTIITNIMFIFISSHLLPPTTIL